MNCLRGFILWILLSAAFITCYSKAVPVKRRMVLRLPFVQHGEQNSIQQRNFIRMINGSSSKIKKDTITDGDSFNNWLSYLKFRNMN